MKLILVRSKGHSRSIELSRRATYMFFATFVAFCSCALVFLGSVIKEASVVNEDVFTEWQSSIEEQTQILYGLKDRTNNQGDAVKVAHAGYGFGLFALFAFEAPVHARELCAQLR